MDVEHTFINHACICVKKNTRERERGSNFWLMRSTFFGVCNIIINSNLAREKRNENEKQEWKEEKVFQCWFYYA